MPHQFYLQFSYNQWSNPDLAPKVLGAWRPIKWM